MNIEPELGVVSNFVLSLDVSLIVVNHKMTK
jgi:hypothetical protein